jgi:hypothetical protein
MNNDIQAARKLLTDLREAYRGLPALMQQRVAHLLRSIPSLEPSWDKAGR